MQLSDHHYNIFELASSNTHEYEYAVDATISSCYKAESQNLLRYDTDIGLASCLISKIGGSKFGTTNGSTTLSGKDCCLFIFQTPSEISHEELEKPLSSILDYFQINAVNKALSTNHFKEANVKQLSKLGIINEELTQAALDQIHNWQDRALTKYCQDRSALMIAC